jgi:hypothetical protein
MTAYGYPCDTEVHGESPIQLREIAIKADDAFLDALIAFAQAALVEVRTLGKRFGHVHFQDKCDAGRDAWPDIVFANTYSSVALDEG